MDLKHDRDEYSIIERAFDLYVKEIKNDLQGAMRYSKLNENNLTEPDYERANGDIQFVYHLKNKIINKMYNKTEELIENNYGETIDKISKQLFNIINYSEQIDDLTGQINRGGDREQIFMSITKYKKSLNAQFNKINNLLQIHKMNEKEFNERFYKILQNEHIQKYYHKLQKLFM